MAVFQGLLRCKTLDRLCSQNQCTLSRPSQFSPHHGPSGVRMLTQLQWFTLQVLLVSQQLQHNPRFMLTSDSGPSPMPLGPSHYCLSASPVDPQMPLSPTPDQSNSTAPALHSNFSLRLLSPPPQSKPQSNFGHTNPVAGLLGPCQTPARSHAHTATTPAANIGMGHKDRSTSPVAISAATFDHSCGIRPAPRWSSPHASLPPPLPPRVGGTPAQRAEYPP